MSGRTGPRVLVVAFNFPPHGAIGTMRTLRVVKRLHSTGWRVTVLTSQPVTYTPGTPIDDGLLAQIPAGVDVIRAGAIRWWERSTGSALQALRRHATALPGGPTVDRGPAPAGARGSKRRGGVARAKDVVDAMLAIPDREIGWLLPALGRTSLHLVRSAAPDVIYSSSPPWTGQLVALGLKALLRKPWVADFRDPWARAPWRSDRHLFAIKAAGILERRVVQSADRVVFVAQGNREEFERHYGEELGRKFDVVPNGCDPAEFDALQGTPLENDGQFVMLHAGSLYGGRTPEPLLRCLAEATRNNVIDRDRFRLRFLGTNGLQDVDLSGLCRELDLSEVVSFTGRVPRADSLRAMMAASSLLLLQPGHTVSVPGKLYEYLAAGRPVFAIAEEGETARLVRASGIGVSVTPDDTQGIIEGLATIVRMGSEPVQRPSRDTYDGNIGAERIEAILREVAGSGTSERASVTPLSND